MKKIKLGKSNLDVSEIALGLMRLSDTSMKNSINIVRTSIDNEINFFDHADIYGAGHCEKLFAQVMKSESISRDSI